MALDIEKEKKAAKLEPPQDVSAEQALLGSILKDSNAFFVAVDYLDDPKYFYVPKHQIIFRAITRLYEKNEPYDITTVADELVKMDKLDQVGGRTYLVDLVQGIASTANVGKYAGIVLEKALLRELIDTSNDIISNCYGMSAEVDDLLDLAEKKVFAITETRLKTEFTPISKLIPQTFEQIEEYQETKGGLIGIETGFTTLDEMTGGLHDGDLVVVAGRPSMGKTALAMNIAEFVAVDKKIPVGVFSIEMSKEQLALRLLCSRARISQHLLRTGRLKDSEWQRLTIAADPLGDADLFIDDSPTLSSLEVRAKARRLKAQYNIGLVIVDYIQMMHGAGRIENRQQEIAMISRALKTLAKELDIPVIAVSQLSRMVEMRGGDKRPQLSDLRESGAIEQDADVVMFVYRPEFYLSHLDRDDPKRLEVEGRAEIIVSKQRNGPTGKVDLAFVKEYARFENLAQFPERPPEAESDIPF